MSSPGNTPVASKLVFVLEEDNSLEMTGLPQGSVMPYLSSLINSHGSLLGNYYANVHPSVPNYHWILTGSNASVKGNSCIETLTTNNLFRQMIANNIQFRFYFEGLAEYKAQGHTARDFVNCDDLPALNLAHLNWGFGTEYSDVRSQSDAEINAQFVDISQLAIDVANRNLPRMSFVIPNLEEDTHDNYDIPRADTWLSRNLPAVLSTSDFQPGGTGVLMVGWDESIQGSQKYRVDDKCSSQGGSGCGGHLPLVFYGPQVKKNFVSQTYYQHQSVLRTMMLLLGLKSGFPNAAESALEISDVFSADVFSPPALSLSVSKNIVAPNETFTATWYNPGTTYKQDWITIVPAGTKWISPYPWFYTNGLSSGTNRLTAPLAAGKYDIVYYQNNGYTELFRKNMIEVKKSCPPPPPCGAAPPEGCNYVLETDSNGCQICGKLVCNNPTPGITLESSKNSVAPNETFTVTWYNSGTTYKQDWITIVPTGTKWVSPYPWFYTEGLSSGTNRLTAPLGAGKYDIVYYQNNGFTELARSKNLIEVQKPECSNDKDCHPINCIQAPCPQPSCVDGKCIPTPSKCGNGICEPGEDDDISKLVFELDSSSTLTNSLVSYWKLDETSGNRKDIVGNNHLVPFNGVTYDTSGVKGYTAKFTATSIRANEQYLGVADNIIVSPGDTDFTFAGWVRLDSTDKSMAIIAKGDTGATREYVLLYDKGFLATSDRFVWSVYDGSGTTKPIVADNFGSPSAGNWYFIVAWHDSVNNQIGIQVNNGKPNVVSYSSGVTDKDSMFTIGAFRDVDDLEINGKIDEVGLWKRILTVQERSDLFGAGWGNTLVLKSVIPTCPQDCSKEFDLSDYPNMFTKGNSFNGVLVVGDYAGSNDVLAVSDIIGGLKPIDPGPFKLASEVNGIEQNIISVGGSCANAITSQIEGYPVDCAQGLKPGLGKINLYSYNGFAHLVVKGFYDSDTLAVARVLANYKDYKLSGVEYTVESPVQQCTDSDGGKDYYVKGQTTECDYSILDTVQGGGTGGCPFAEDSCLTESIQSILRENDPVAKRPATKNTLQEFYCERNKLQSVYYECPNGCKDGACAQSAGITIDKVETDNKFYGLNEKVSISASATSSAGFPEAIIAEVQDPNYQGTKVTMTASVCSVATTNSNIPVTCSYQGIFSNTAYEGYYNVNVGTGNFNGNAYTSFSVLDREKTGKYLILNDIGLYKLENAVHSPDNSLGIDTYVAYYSTEQLSNQAGVYVFGSREVMFEFLNKALEQVNYYTQTIDGNLVYVVMDGSTPVFAWTRENLLIVSVPGRVYTVQYDNTASTSVASKNSESSSKKTISSPGIFGNVVVSQPPTTTKPINQIDEVVLAYLKKHPSDLDKAPPVKKITKKDVINWIDKNCADSTNPPVPMQTTSSGQSSGAVTGNVISKVFVNKEYWKD
ncbi:MAG TPA: alkaline phosphatase family protein [Candidatus Nanoarchaeia archaeon]|nr:alkaline phosphatase family protein [Candidatus Nanoarchaeia archaeon]